MLMTIIEGGLEVYDTAETALDYASWVYDLFDGAEPEPSIADRLAVIEKELGAIEKNLKAFYLQEKLEHLKALTHDMETDIVSYYGEMVGFKILHPKGLIDDWVHSVLDDAQKGMAAYLYNFYDLIINKNLIQQYVEISKESGLNKASLQMVSYMTLQKFINIQKKALLCLVNANIFNDVEKNGKTREEARANSKELVATTLAGLQEQINLINNHYENDNVYTNCHGDHGLDKYYTRMYCGKVNVPDEGDGKVVTGMRFVKHDEEMSEKWMALALTRAQLVTTTVDPSDPEKPRAGALVDEYETAPDDFTTVPGGDPAGIFLEPVMAPKGYVVVGAAIYNSTNNGDNDKYYNSCFLSLQCQKLTITRDGDQYQYQLDTSSTTWVDARTDHDKHSWLTNFEDYRGKYTCQNTPSPANPIIGARFNKHGDKVGIEVYTLNNYNHADYCNIPVPTEATTA